MKNCSCKPSSSSSNPNKIMVSQLKPKVRIIHIFAPEIIKTDVANFRELVQRLTGKPDENDWKIKNKKPRNSNFSKKMMIEKKKKKNTPPIAESTQNTIQLSDDEEERDYNYEEIWGRTNDKNVNFLNGFDHEFNSTDVYPIVCGPFAPQIAFT